MYIFYGSICEHFNVYRAVALKCVRRFINALDAVVQGFIVWSNEEHP